MERASITAERLLAMTPWPIRVRSFPPLGYLALHLTLGLIATAAVLGFSVVAEEVFSGQKVSAFDHALANALQASSSPQWQEVFRVITWFGKAEVIATLSAAIGIALFIRRERVLALGWIIAQAGAAVLVVTLKSAFERSRPELTHVSPVDGWSFPSGHALSTFVLAGLGAYLVLRSALPWTTKAIAVAAAIGWCITMGFTRLYLGVHFASDVLAGMIAATGWLAACVSGIELGERRRRYLTATRALGDSGREAQVERLRPRERLDAQS